VQPNRRAVASTICSSVKPRARIAAAQPAPAKSAQQLHAEAADFGPSISRGCDRPACGKGTRCRPHLDALLSRLAGE